MTRLPNGDWDYRPAVDSLIDIHMGTGRGRPVQPRVLPPRPKPRHLTNPAPAPRDDLPAVRRTRRYRQALARITKRAA